VQHQFLEEEKMAKEEIFDKLKELVVDQLGVEEDEVTMEATMQDDLGADSLDLVDLVMSVEEEFGVKVADEDLENIKTVGDIVNYIEERA
jgi:acyl carrier protein